jgi:phosphatidylserine/phosphatidylglycerophosphate/cardiolipin synthase-like enzyme
VLTFNLPQGFGAQKGFWQVFFTAPTGSRDAKTYVNGIENQLASAIQKLQPGNTLDIAAFEFNLPVLTAAVLDAHQRGVIVRMVVDTQNALEDDDSTLPQLVKAGIPVVDDKRSAFMHNKFMILNGATVWTGSWNYTINDTYRNNNNAIALRSRRLVERYQAEFNQMFNQKLFGPKKAPSQSNTFTQDGVPIQVYFAPEDKVLPAIIQTITGAKKSIRFMTFSFTDYDVAKAILDRSAANKSIRVQGIFETTGSETAASELRTLMCAGLDARQDGNPFVLHHKVFIVDDSIVITGSFNISTNATESNDENLVIIPDPDLAAQYRAEFDRRWAEARKPSNITCQ